jgi:hypothetical protein
MPGSIFSFVDFRGGYATSVPSEHMADNEMLKADDVTWNDGLDQRAGHSRYASVTGSLTRGSIRVKIEGAWRTVRAVQGTSNVAFEVGTTTSFSTLTHASATSYTITSGSDVQFARLGEKVVAVNGVDQPSVIYATASSVFVDTVERLDTRDIDDAYWYAGQFSSTTASGNYGTNTDAAQSSSSVTFELQASATGAGFWVASDLTFNLPEVLDMEATSSATFAFEYLGRASIGSSVTWVSYTPNDVPTWTVAGDRAMEFDYPLDSVTGDNLLATGPISLGEPLINRFCWRAVNRETDLAAPLDAQGLNVKHSQYLRQINLGYKPDTVAEHGSKIWLGMGNWLRFGAFGKLTNWMSRDFEFFHDGGSIQAMVPGVGRDGLVVLMDSGIHTIFGTSLKNVSVDRDQSKIGGVSKRGAVVHSRVMYFIARDGIYAWDGLKATKISKHIQSDIDSWTLTDAAAIAWKGKILFSFPTNSRILEFDPDTFRSDPMGDGRVSFFRHTGVGISQFQWQSSADDNDLLLGIDNTNVYILSLYSGTVDKIDATATINYDVQSKYYHFGSYHTPKVFRRPTFRVADVSATAGDDYTIKLFTQNQYGEASATATLTASVASGIHVASVGVPPGMDGYNFGFGVNHDTQYHAKFFGVSLEVEERAQ